MLASAPMTLAVVALACSDRFCTRHSGAVKFGRGETTSGGAARGRRITPSAPDSPPTTLSRPRDTTGAHLAGPNTSASMRTQESPRPPPPATRQARMPDRHLTEADMPLLPTCPCHPATDDCIRADRHRTGQRPGANRLDLLDPTTHQRLDFLTDLHNCDLLVLDDFLTIPVTGHTAAGLLNMLAASGRDIGSQGVADRVARSHEHFLSGQPHARPWKRGHCRGRLVALVPCDLVPRRRSGRLFATLSPTTTVVG